MACVDGIVNKIDPGNPNPLVNTYHMDPAEFAKSTHRARTFLEAAINALEKDHEFLFKGGVFTADVVETWIEYKRENEIDP